MHDTGIRAIEYQIVLGQLVVPYHDRARLPRHADLQLGLTRLGYKELKQIITLVLSKADYRLSVGPIYIESFSTRVDVLRNQWVIN